MYCLSPTAFVFSPPARAAGTVAVPDASCRRGTYFFSRPKKEVPRRHEASGATGAPRHERAKKKQTPVGGRHTFKPTVFLYETSACGERRNRASDRCCGILHRGGCRPTLFGTPRRANNTKRIIPVLIICFDTPNMFGGNFPLSALRCRRALRPGVLFVDIESGARRCKPGQKTRRDRSERWIK